MKASIVIDEVGRLVLPKEIREAIVVSGRTSVLVEVVDNTARISIPKTALAAPKRKMKRLVYGGTLPGDWNSGDAVLNTRERRLRR
jgi:bifunctional DNA-binding transcriptional regulator/antitoxin component of YhaV-PrlF toxin-antitoxin module